MHCMDEVIKVVVSFSIDPEQPSIPEPIQVYVYQLELCIERPSFS